MSAILVSARQSADTWLKALQLILPGDLPMSSHVKCSCALCREAHQDWIDARNSVYVDLLDAVQPFSSNSELNPEVRNAAQELIRIVPLIAINGPRQYCNETLSSCLALINRIEQIVRLEAGNSAFIPQEFDDARLYLAKRLGIEPTPF